MAVPPYPGLSHSHTHPSRLGALGTLLGLTPTAPDDCRLLEIGCADGSNLLPMAEAYPAGSFVGIDIDATGVAAAREAIAALGLTNVRVEQRDLRDLDAADGVFDYIVAHGVFSWVAQPVQDALLAGCRDRLAPQGIAFVSYNTYPGWHLLAGIRGLLQFATRGEADPLARARAGRALLAGLTERLAEAETPFAALLEAYAQLTANRDGFSEADCDALMAHDELAPVNAPCYFHEFVARAAATDLAYVCDAAFSSGVLNDLGPVRDLLTPLLRGPADLDQYADFLRTRPFRQSLLCRGGVALDRRLRPGPALARLAFTSPLRPDPAQPDRFHHPTGGAVTLTDPLVGAAFTRLAAAWPGPVAFPDLLATAAAENAGEDAGDRLGGALLEGLMRTPPLCEVWLQPPDFVTEVSARPKVPGTVRRQAGRDAGFVTNRRHERMVLPTDSRLLLSFLDGRHDHRALAAAVPQAEGGGDLPDRLAWLASAALLIS